MKLIKNICLSVICLLIVSCENIVMYRSYQHIPKEGWNKNDTLIFNLTVNDSLTNDSSSGLYGMELLVRNRSDYQYQNLILSVEHNFPDTAIWNTDTIQFNIANEHGKWLGKGISGLYEVSAIITAGNLIHPHDFTLKLVSLMNDSILLGLNDVGIIIQKK